MLKSLQIVNYAIIDKLLLEYSNGLNIVTGETGAGKSIMLGAMSLLIGKRADSKVLFDKEKKCVVEGIYNNLPKSINKFLEKEGFDVEEELIIRREINASGKSRSFVNDTPATLKTLESIANMSIDLNRQFELLDIQSADFQVNMIDHLAGITTKVETYKKEFRTLKEMQAELKKLQASESTAASEYEFLKFQFNEIDALALMDGEQKSLEEELAILSKSEEIIELSNASNYQIDEAENSLSDSLRNLSNQWSSLANLNPDYQKISDAFINIEAQLEDVSSLISSALENVNTDPSRKSEVESRINTLYALLQKHRANSQEDLILIFDQIQEKLGNYDSIEATIIELQNKISALEQDLRISAKEISNKRAKIFPKLEKQIKAILSDLSMNSARLKVANSVSESLNTNGIDNIEIQFAANTGSEFKSIKSVASGGELSRLMLAMKSTVAGKMELPTMVFDEIDTGVSGEVAHKMGDLMSKLSEKHQVIVITHSPQVASKAQTHFHIYKEESKKRTFTRMKVLNQEERINEIAKMLSGDKLSDSAISNAKEFLGITA